jgi:hypothetical protein
MKHLTTYKLFESEVTDYIKDIFLEVEDKGIYISVAEFNITKHLRKFIIYIGSNSSNYKLFKIEDVYDSIMMAKSYMEDQKYNLFDMEGKVLSKSDSIVKYVLIDRFNNDDKEFFKDKEFTLIELGFVKRLNRENLEN